MTIELEPSEPIQTLGKANGPAKYVPELGMEVGTFVQAPSNSKPVLMHHVPVHMRGPFRPDQLANFDPGREYHIDRTGWLLCYHKVTDQKTQKLRRCKRKAINRYPRCAAHGGAVHPLDHLIVDRSKVGDLDDEGSMNRYQLFKAGLLTVADLDDEEIQEQGFRMPSGKIYRPKSLPREWVNELSRRIYEQASVELKANTVNAAKTLAEIMMDKNIDAGIRRQCAESILDRNLGKAPQTVQVMHQARWEEVFEAIGGGSREESRRRRGYVPPEAPEAVDVEEVPLPQPIDIESDQFTTEDL